MTNCIKFPINIALAQGAYSLELLIGSQNKLVKLLIDTGSSTIAIHPKNYYPSDDNLMELTQYAQCVTYGVGGWAGPVVKSKITYTNGSESFDVVDAPFSIVSNQLDNSFLGLDGILGMAYHHLNKAYNLSEYYQSNSHPDEGTYPWTFSKEIINEGIPAFKNFLRKYPEKDITPLFTEFEENNIGLNKFTLQTHRSIVYVPETNMSTAQLENEILNQGLFVIGEVENDTNLYSGKSNKVKVLHDAYYNTNLRYFQVEGFDKIQAFKLDNAHLDSFFTNSIIDSGSSYLMLQEQLYLYFIDCLNQINLKLVTYIDSFNLARKNKENYVPLDLDLQEWPKLYFTFEGLDSEDVTLCCHPDHYWQLHAFGPNQAFFTILKQIKKWPNQSIIGLPVISSYLCIFDRSYKKSGIINFVENIK